MDKIREYIFALMIVSVSCAAVNMLAPEEGKISKYVHFLVSLVISAVMLLPIHSLVDELPVLINGDIFAETEYSFSSSMDAQNILIKETVDVLKEKVKSQTEKRFNKKIEKIDIEYNADNIEDIKITKVEIYYKKTNRYLVSDTKNYIKELLCCECEVKEFDGE